MPALIIYGGSALLGMFGWAASKTADATEKITNQVVTIAAIGLVGYITYVKVFKK